jgi:hypothetical protein
MPVVPGTNTDDQDAAAATDGEMCSGLGFGFCRGTATLTKNNMVKTLLKRYRVIYTCPVALAFTYHKVPKLQLYLALLRNL